MKVNMLQKKYYVYSIRLALRPFDPIYILHYSTVTFPCRWQAILQMWSTSIACAKQIVFQHDGCCPLVDHEGIALGQSYNEYIEERKKDL